MSATRVWSGKYSRSLLATIDWCLELDPLNRPQSVFALQQVLLGKREPPVRGRKSPWARIKETARRLMPPGATH